MPDQAPASLPAAIRLHDQLEAEGMSHDEIVAVLGAGLGYSLTQLPPASRRVHIAAHLEALGTILGHGQSVEHLRNPSTPAGAKIDALWAWIVTEPDGSEGVVGGSVPGPPWMITPFVGADRAQIEDYRGAVLRVAASSGCPIKLVRYGRPEIMERLGGKVTN